MVSQARLEGTHYRQACELGGQRKHDLELVLRAEVVCWSVPAGVAGETRHASMHPALVVSCPAAPAPGMPHCAERAAADHRQQTRAR